MTQINVSSLRRVNVRSVCAALQQCSIQHKNVRLHVHAAFHLLKHGVN